MKKESDFFTKLPDGSVKCLACANYCTISEGEYGKCSLRTNENGSLQIQNYGNLTTIKKLFLRTHFYKNLSVLSIGSLGCCFKCTNCDDWDISHFTEVNLKELGREKVTYMIRNLGTQISPKKIIDYCKSSGLNAIYYNHTEPSISLEFYLEVMNEAYKNNILNIWNTNAYFSTEGFDACLPFLNLAIVQLKSISPEFYKKHYRTRINLVLDNIYKLYLKKIKMEIINTIIPDENDSESEIKRLALFLYNISPDIPLIFKRFYPNFHMNDKEMTPIESLQKALSVAEKVGITYTYISV